MIDSIQTIMDPAAPKPKDRPYLRRSLPIKPEPSRHQHYKPGTECISIRSHRARVAHWKYAVMLLTCEARTAAGRVWDTQEEAQEAVTEWVKALPSMEYRKIVRLDRTPVECEVCGKWHLSNEEETTLNAWGADAMDIVTDEVLRGRRIDRALLARIEGRMERKGRERNGG